MSLHKGLKKADGRFTVRTRSNLAIFLCEDEDAAKLCAGACVMFLMTLGVYTVFPVLCSIFSSMAQNINFEGKTSFALDHDILARNTSFRTNNEMEYFWAILDCQLGMARAFFGKVIVINGLDSAPGFGSKRACPRRLFKSQLLFSVKALKDEASVVFTHPRLSFLSILTAPIDF